MHLQMQLCLLKSIVFLVIESLEILFCMLEFVMSGNNKLDIIKPHDAVGFLLSGLHHAVLGARLYCH